MSETMASALRNAAAIAGAFAAEALGQHDDAATIREWGAMRITPRTDHAAAIARLVQEAWTGATERERCRLADIHNAGQLLREERDALAAERDALRAYAKFLEDTGPRKTVGRISDERAEHGVAEIMAREDR